MVDKIHQEIKGKTDPQEIMDAVNKFAESKSFSVAASKSAQQIVTMLNNAQFNNWRTAATVSSKGRQIYNALLLETKKGHPIGSTYRTLIDQNATIIKTLPHDIAQKTSRKASKLAIEGMRASEIAKEIKKDFPKAGKASAKLIARTEVSKASTALAQSRSENMGVDWYVWRTSEDSRVRSSHAHMDDVIVKWSNPPAPEALDGEKSQGHYHAGNIYNCRCYPEPLVSLSLVKWPHKVYHNGSIQTFTRGQFEGISGKAKAEPFTPKSLDELISEMVEADMKAIPKASTKVPKPVIQKQSLPQTLAKAASRGVSKVYTALTGEEVKQTVKKAEKFFNAKPKESAAFYHYTGNGYHDMNDYMRGKIKVGDVWKEVREELLTMYDAYKDAPPALTRDTQLYRATGFSHIENAGLDRKAYEKKLEKINNLYGDLAAEKAKELEDDLNAQLIGRIIEEKALTSTSYKQGAFGSSKPIQLTIDVDADKAQAVQLTGISSFKNEAEILFNMGMLNEVQRIEVKRANQYSEFYLHFHMKNLGHVEKDLQELRNSI